MDSGSSQQPTAVVVPNEARALDSYGARFLPLQANTKQPNKGTKGRTDAVSWDSFFKLDHENYGIKLDGWAIVIDIDRPDCHDARFLTKRMGETPTWLQKTKKGAHYLFLLPAGTRMRGGNLLDGNGEIYGQVLANAYIVGPGSRIDGDVVYELQDPRMPIAAPAWLIEHAQNEAKAPVLAAVGARRDQIPRGEHDNALASILAQVARSTASLSESAMLKIADFIANKSGILDASDGYDVAGLSRLTRSALQFGDKKPERDGIAMLPDQWRTGAEVDLTPVRTAWLVPGYVPEVGLGILYGDGKAGKTTWLGWVAARITMTGKAVIFVPSGETTFEEFVRMVSLYADQGAKPELLMEYPNPELFLLPSKATELGEALENPAIGNGVKAVIIDAIYSHFEATPGMHEASRARHCMKPLAEVATRLGLSVLGTIHENAAGNMLGSREMRNVARSVVHAVRGTSGPLTIWPAGANVLQVEYGTEFDGEQIAINDPITGKPATYTDLHNEQVTQSVWKLKVGAKKVLGSNPVSDGSGVSLNSVPDPAAKRSRKKPVGLDVIS